MWAVFLFTGPLLAYHFERLCGLDRFRFAMPGQLLVAASIFVLGWVIAWTSAYFMVMYGEGTPLPIDATHKLVIMGPYCYIRNPMAFSSLVQGAAVGIGAGSPLILVYIAIGALLWNYLARPWEEADLAAKFGTEYLAYKNEVRCWAPRLRPSSPDSHVTAS